MRAPALAVRTSILILVSSTLLAAQGTPASPATSAPLANGPQNGLGPIVSGKYDVQVVETTYQEGPPNKIRLYLPVTEETVLRPFIVFFHGGGWTSGDLTSFDSLLDPVTGRPLLLEIAAQYGVVTAAPSMPTGPQAQGQEQIDNIGELVEFMKLRKDLYKLDIDRVGIYGYSSGAYNGLAWAMERAERENVRLVVASGTPIDVYAGSLTGILAPYFYVSWLLTPEDLGSSDPGGVLLQKLVAANLDNFVDDSYLGTTKFVFVHDYADQLSTIDHVRDLNEKLFAAGADSEVRGAQTGTSHLYFFWTAQHANRIKKAVQQYLAVDDAVVNGDDLPLE